MSDVYKIGVRLAMTSNVSQVLGVLGRDVLGFHAKVKDLEGGLNRVKLAMGGALAIGAGAAMLISLRQPLDEAIKFEQVVARFSQFGLGSKLNSDAVSFAKQMNIAGQTYTDAMKNMIEAQGVFRESGLSGPDALRGAKLSAPILGKIDFANRVLSPDEQKSRHTSGLDMLRFIEMKGGVNDPHLFNSLANQGYKAIQSSGGNVNWSLYRQFMATGGVAARGLSNDSLFGQMEPVIGELKSRAGTALMTSFNRLTGITRVPNQVAHELVKGGIWDGSKIAWNSQGGIKSMSGNPLKDGELFSKSQFDWYQKNVMPMYQAQHLSNADMARSDAMIGGRTGGMMFSLFRTQQGPIQASLASQRKALGVDESYKVAKGTTAGKFADAQAKFNNLMIEAGSAILPLVNRALGALIPMMASLASWMGRHTAIVKGIIIGFAALGVALVAAGAIALAVAAGPIALWTLAIGAIGAVIAGVVTYFSQWRNMIGVLKAALAGLLGPFGTFLGLIQGAYSLLHGGAAVKPGAGAPPASNGVLPNHNGRLWHSSLPFLPPPATKPSVGAPPPVAQWIQHPPGKTPLSPFLAPPAHKQSASITVNTHLDGRIVATNTMRHIGQAIGGPQVGMSGVDPTATAYNPGMGYA